MGFTWSQVARPGEGRILLLVMDGVGDLPHEGQTPLSLAATPNLDALAAKGALGTHLPVAPGIAPGSGIAHLALFGYDPLAHPTGRGVFEALGLGLELAPGDLAVRGNLATFADGLVADRRAGRIHGGAAAARFDTLSRITSVEGCEFTLVPGKGHRFALRIRGPGLAGPLAGNDPGAPGLPARFPNADADTRRSRQVLAAWAEAAADALRQHNTGNGVLLRGADTLRPLQSLWERHQITARAIANYPAYRGVARLVGMEAPLVPNDPATRVEAAAAAEEDLIFFHHKETDAAGEDGDLAGKTAAVEKGDALLGQLLATGDFAAVIVTGDHCTPWSLQAHSWHPVPFLLAAPGLPADATTRLTEAQAAQGSLGPLHAKHLLPLALAHTGRLATYLA